MIYFRKSYKAAHIIESCVDDDDEVDMDEDVLLEGFDFAELFDILLVVLALVEVVDTVDPVLWFVRPFERPLVAV